MGKTVGLVFAVSSAKRTCPHCRKEYKTGEALAKHIKDKHSDAACSGGPSQE